MFDILKHKKSKGKLTIFVLGEGAEEEGCAWSILVAGCPFPRMCLSTCQMAHESFGCSSS